MPLLHSVHAMAKRPIEQIGSIKDLQSEAISDGESIGMRLLFALQIITSIVALPIILVIGLLEAAIQSCRGKGTETIIELGNALKYHLIYALPGSIAGLALPLETAQSALKAQEECLQENISIH